CGRHRPHLPRPSDFERGSEGSGVGGGKARDQFLAPSCAATAGKGATRKGGGRGVGGEATHSGPAWCCFFPRTMKLRVRRPHHRAARGPPPRLSRGDEGPRDDGPTTP